MSPTANVQSVAGCGEESCRAVALDPEEVDDAPDLLEPLWPPRQRPENRFAHTVEGVVPSRHPRCPRT